MLTSTTPSIFLLSVTTCDAQALHISAEISNEISSVSAVGARSIVTTGEPHATDITRSNRKGAKRTVVIVRLAPKNASVRKY
jgi:hypothetical protein